jgi:hypothetical protein
VLEALKKALSSDPDPRPLTAAGALTNLACDETGERWGTQGTVRRYYCFDQGRESRRSDTASLVFFDTQYADSCITRQDGVPRHTLDTLVVASSAKHPTVPLSSLSNQGPRLRIEKSWRDTRARHLRTDICMSTTTGIPRSRAMPPSHNMHLVNEKKNHKLCVTWPFSMPW